MLELLTNKALKIKWIKTQLKKQETYIVNKNDIASTLQHNKNTEQMV